MNKAFYKTLGFIVFFLSNTTNLKSQLSKRDNSYQIPFQLNSFILIEGKINNRGNNYKFIVDNNAPMIIFYKNDIKNALNLKSIGNNISFPVFTPGLIGKQEIYETKDSLFFTDFVVKPKFIHVLLSGTKTFFADSTSGILGYDGFVDNIWLIDFTKQVISIASDLNAVRPTTELIKIISTFKKTALQEKIKINVSVNGSKPIDCLLDLGYRGSILLPHKTFFKIGTSEKHEISKSIMQTVGGETNTTFYTLVGANVNVGGIKISSDVTTTNDYSQDYGLIGISFLKQFNYLLIDFKANEVFVSN